jgi:mycofactocin system glycosyltransferase
VRLTLDPGVQRLADGRLIGGTPRRLVRLSPAGERALAALLRGEAPTPASRSLAGRLLEAGMLRATTAGPATTMPGVTVVVPARDRPSELARCLRALRSAAAAVVVVDDGSHGHEAVDAVARRHGATLIRRERPGGPAAARNDGLAAAGTDLVAFIDSDCLPGPDWLIRLASHLADPQVAAVAPRIVPLPRASGTPVDRYLALRSPLDMGSHPAVVSPRGRVRYVPAAALLVRRAALGDGFDEALRYGEDVDLVWRLRRAGWQVRYDPAATVYHDEPRRLRDVLARRARYGTSAAPLSARHPDALPAAVIVPEAALTVAALAAGRPRMAAMAAAAATTRRAAHAMQSRLPLRLAAESAARSTAVSCLEAARAAATFAPGALLLAAVRRRDVRPALVLAAPGLAGWRRGALDPVRFAALAALDDAAYGAGVIWSAYRSRVWRALRPQLS